LADCVIQIAPSPMLRAELHPGQSTRSFDIVDFAALQ
jgi:hypothetical protein